MGITCSGKVAAKLSQFPQIESGQREAQEWLERQSTRLLPVTYHPVTFTVPEQLRAAIRSHQRLMLDILFRESAATLEDVAGTKLRGELGLLGALHTWSRQLTCHLHIHYIVPAVALRKDGILVTPKDPDYLLCVDVLSVRMRTRFERALSERDPARFHRIQPSVWRKAWIVHSEPVGCGEHALKYLSRYIYRTAMSSERHLQISPCACSEPSKEDRRDEQPQKPTPDTVRALAL